MNKENRSCSSADYNHHLISTQSTANMALKFDLQNNNRNSIIDSERVDTDATEEGVQIVSNIYEFFRESDRNGAQNKFQEQPKQKLNEKNIFHDQFTLDLSSCQETTTETLWKKIDVNGNCTDQKTEDQIVPLNFQMSEIRQKSTDEDQAELLSKSNLMLIDLEAVSAGNHPLHSSKDDNNPKSERHFFDILSLNRNTIESCSSSNIDLISHQNQRRQKHGMIVKDNLTDTNFNENMSQQITQKRVAFRSNTLKNNNSTEDTDQGQQKRSAMMPPMHGQKFMRANTGVQRSSKSVRQPHFSPINERRTTEEKEQAKERNLQKKRTLKFKRELTHASQDVFNQIVDQETLVMTYQIYYQESMFAQSHKFAHQTFIDQQLHVYTSEIASNCIEEAKEKNRIVAAILKESVESSVDQSEQRKLSRSDIEKDAEIAIDMEKVEAEKKESLANDACEKLMSLIIGQHIASAALESKQPDIFEIKDIPKQEEQESIEQQVDVRETLAQKMGDFACSQVEESMIPELIKNAIEEHILLDFAFEMVLKSLLREPSKQINQIQIKTNPEEVSIVAPFKSEVELPKKPSHAITYSTNLSEKTGPISTQRATIPPKQHAIRMGEKQSTNQFNNSSSESSKHLKKKLVVKNQQHILSLSPSKTPKKPVGAVRAKISLPISKAQLPTNNCLIVGSTPKDRLQSQDMPDKQLVNCSPFSQSSPILKIQKTSAPKGLHKSSSNKSRQSSMIGKGISNMRSSATLMSMTGQAQHQKLSQQCQPQLKYDRTRSFKQQQQSHVNSGTLNRKNNQLLQQQVTSTSAVATTANVQQQDSTPTKKNQQNQLRSRNCGNRATINKNVAIQRTNAQQSNQVTPYQMMIPDQLTSETAPNIFSQASLLGHQQLQLRKQPSCQEVASTAKTLFKHKYLVQSEQGASRKSFKKLNQYQASFKENSGMLAYEQPLMTETHNLPKQESFTSFESSKMSNVLSQDQQYQTNPVAPSTDSKNYQAQPSQSYSQLPFKQKTIIKSSHSVKSDTECISPPDSCYSTQPKQKKLQSSASSKAYKGANQQQQQAIMSKRSVLISSQQTNTMAQSQAYVQPRIVKSGSLGKIAARSSFVEKQHKTTNRCSNGSSATGSAAQVDLANYKMVKYGKQTHLQKQNQQQQQQSQVTSENNSKLNKQTTSKAGEKKRPPMSPASLKEASSTPAKSDLNSLIKSQVLHNNTTISKLSSSNTLGGKFHNVNPTGKSPKYPNQQQQHYQTGKKSRRHNINNVPRDLQVTASGDVSHFVTQTSFVSNQNEANICKTSSQAALDLVYDGLVRNQVQKVAGRYIQGVFLDHFYRKTIKKVVRMCLFQVIQESVDLIYFLEEDTISSANGILDIVIMQEIRQLAYDTMEEEKDAMLQINPNEAALTRNQHHKYNSLTALSSFKEEDDDSLQVIQDDEECHDKQSNIHKSIKNSRFSSPRMMKKRDFQAEPVSQQQQCDSNLSSPAQRQTFSFLKQFNQDNITSSKRFGESKQLIDADRRHRVSLKAKQGIALKNKSCQSQAKMITRDSRPLLVQLQDSPQRSDNKTGTLAQRNSLFKQNNNMQRTSAQKPHKSIYKHVNAFSVYPVVSAPQMAFSSGVQSCNSPDKMGDFPRFQHRDTRQHDEVKDEDSDTVAINEEQNCAAAQPALKQHQDVFFSTPQIQLPHRLKDHGEHYDSVPSDEDQNSPILSESLGHEQSSDIQVHQETAEVESSIEDFSRMARLLDQNVTSAQLGQEHDSSSALISPRVTDYVLAQSKLVQMRRDGQNIGVVPSLSVQQQQQAKHCFNPQGKHPQVAGGLSARRSNNRLISHQ